MIKRFIRFGSRDVRSSQGERGFTLLELLVVLAILGLLAAIVAPRVVKYLGSSRSQTAAIQIKNIVASLELYRLDAGRFPTDQEGLGALLKAPASVPVWNGPYLADAAALTDPWGKPYRYQVPGKHREVDVYSFGADGTEGGSGEDKDVGN